MAVIKTTIDETEASAAREYLLPLLMEEKDYSAYGVHSVLNLILTANGLEKVRPQMMYNYARNGLIVRGEKIFGTSLRHFTPSEVCEFLIRYCHRNGVEIKIGQPTNVNQLELDLESVTE